MRALGLALGVALLAACGDSGPSVSVEDVPEDTWVADVASVEDVAAVEEVAAELPELPHVAPDLPDVAPDLPDVAPDLPDVPDVAPDLPPEVAEVGPDVPPDVPDAGPELPPDVHDVPAVPDAPDDVPDTPLEPDSVFSECEALGIADSWAGDWSGTIDYDMDTAGLFNPEQGTLSALGTLTFEIGCIDSKLVVTGEMDGTAQANGWEPVPFTLGLEGYYDPTNEALSAEIVDGVVTMSGIVELYFEGTMVGDLTSDDAFAGTWEGHYTGANTELILGEALGDGVWSAAPAD